MEANILFVYVMRGRINLSSLFYSEAIFEDVDDVKKNKVQIGFARRL